MKICRQSIHYSIVYHYVMIHFLMCKEISSVILPIIYLTLTNIYETMRFKVTSMI